MAVPFSAAWADSKHNDLVPPPESSVESRDKDIARCLGEAWDGFYRSGQKALDEKSKMALKGRATHGFIDNGVPVVGKNHAPARHKSLFGFSLQRPLGGTYGPTKLSDRHVVCLLGRGYRWADEPGENPPAATPTAGYPGGAPRALSPEATVTSIPLPKEIGEVSSLRGVVGGAVGCGRNKCFFVDSVSQQVMVRSPESPPFFAGFGFLLAANGFGSWWVPESDHGEAAIHRLDEKTFQETAKVPLPDKFIGPIFIAGNSVWAFSGEDPRYLCRVDPLTNEVTAKTPVPKDFVTDSVTALPSLQRGGTVAEGSLWAVGSQSGILRRLDLDSGQAVAEIRVGPPLKVGWLHSDSYTGITFGEEALWITDTKGNLIKVDAKTNQVAATIPLAFEAQSPVFGGGFVWVSARYNLERFADFYYVLKIDPRTNQTVDFVPAGLGMSLMYLTAGEDGVWQWWAGKHELYLWRIGY